MGQAMGPRNAVAFGRPVVLMLEAPAVEESPPLLRVTAEWETSCACDIRAPLQSNKRYQRAASDSAKQSYSKQIHSAAATLFWLIWTSLIFKNMYSEHEYFYNHFRLQLRKEDNFASSLPLLLLSCSLHSGKVFCIVKAYAKCGREKKNLPNLCVFDSKAAVYISLL